MKNILFNGSFEYGDPPIGYTLFGVDATLVRSSVQKAVGNYSALLTRNGHDCYFYRSLPDFASYQSKYVTLGCQVYAIVASRARISIYDGLTWQSSIFQTGVAGFQWLTTTLLVVSYAPSLSAIFEIVNGDTSAYFDKAKMVEGTVCEPDYSFIFNSVNMADYGLRVRNFNLPFLQAAESTQLRDRAYASESIRPEVEVSLDCAVWAADLDNLKSCIDSIKAALNIRGDSELHLDTYDDRYWLARFSSIEGSIRTARAWEGTITFILHDPVAYDNSEVSSDHTIDENPEEIEEVAAGTEYAEPVYTLTCDDTLTATTVKIENTTTGEILEWTGNLVASDVLEIDCRTWLVKLNGVEDMATINGSFPRLQPGANEIEVSGFSGSLNILYRPRYI